MKNLLALILVFFLSISAEAAERSVSATELQFYRDLTPSVGHSKFCCSLLKEYLEWAQNKFETVSHQSDPLLSKSKDWLVLQKINRTWHGYTCSIMSSTDSGWKLSNWHSEEDGSVSHRENFLDEKDENELKSLMKSVGTIAQNVFDCGSEYGKDQSIVYLNWQYGGNRGHAVQISPYSDRYFRHTAPRLSALIIDMEQFFKRHFK